MEVADAVVRETLRVIPAVGGAFRKTTQTAVFDGYQVSGRLHVDNVVNG